MKYLTGCFGAILAMLLPFACADCSSSSNQMFPLLFPSTDAYSIDVDEDIGNMLIGGWTTNYASMASGNFLQMRD